MEAVLAILVLVSLLTASGVLPNKATTKAPTKGSLSEVSILTAPQRQPVCGETQPQYRDLTIPYEKQIAQPSATVEDRCDD